MIPKGLLLPFLFIALRISMSHLLLPSSIKEYLELLLCCQLVLNCYVVKSQDGIFAFSVVLNLFSFPVWNSRIRHWVSMISVAKDLNKERSIINSPIFSPFKDLSNLKYIVSLKSNTWNHITSLVKLCIHWWSQHWCSHTIFVILTDIKSR